MKIERIWDNVVYFFDVIISSFIQIELSEYSKRINWWFLGMKKLNDLYINFDYFYWTYVLFFVKVLRILTFIQNLKLYKKTFQLLKLLFKNIVEDNNIILFNVQNITLSPSSLL